MRKSNTQQRSSVSGQFVVAGRARDGVEILRQIIVPSNFTRQQAKRVVDRIKDSRSVSRPTDPVLVDAK